MLTKREATSSSTKTHRLTIA